MSDKTLVIVESPTKAKTITKFLGKDYIVTASNGHIRDLPNSAAEIPSKLKKEPWAKMGVNIEKDFEPLYIIPPRKKDQVAKLKESLKSASSLLLATDEDREGESISWHLLDTLSPKIPVKRLVFHEITKEAIQKALTNARDIDMNLVRAQETRRVVDRLFGYEVSPILWKKVAPKLSAGRVQSVTIRLLVERERERIKFRSADYWDIKAECLKSDSRESFEAELTHLSDTRIASGKDFDPDTGKLKSSDKVVLLDEKTTNELAERLKSKTALVTNVEERPYSTTPPAPFVTSTLQQEANRKLRYSAQRTMRTAQQLYENGLITYMRTDSTTLSDEALNAARAFISEEYGKEFLPDKPRVYATKVKNAQEAHEAIRPAGSSFTRPEQVLSKLGEEAFKLYDLIWKRTVASQMENARGTHISITLEADEARFRASGKTISFPGFLRAYVEGSDDPEADLADQEKILPQMKANDKIEFSKLIPLSHSTQPPARYTEGSLIKELEKRGIGRPSTWASVVELVLNRQYAFKKGTALVPSFTAMAVVNMLEKHFTTLLDYDFTARLEDDLDAISRGECENLSYLRSFYFGSEHPGLKELVTKGESGIDPRDVCGIPLGKDSEGRDIEVRVGRYGPFISNGENRASVPDSLPPDELSMEKALELLLNAEKGPESIGTHPDGQPIFLKVGRFGPYVQLGESGEGKEKPKMASLLPGMALDEVTPELAIKLLSMPRELGVHPESGDVVLSKLGPYGPYVESGKERRTITAGISPLEITLEEALTLLSQPKTRGRGGAQTSALKDLGEDPVAKAQVQLKSGRYGPYVTNGTTNASIPKGVDPMNFTLEAALELLREREAAAPAGPAKGKKKSGTSKKKASGTKEKTEEKSKKKEKPKKKPSEKKSDKSEN
ncbi:MAG TPA: type I DNA topoisomerase [Oligoflexia bacterium]|nr:type I DNA topoisomerase [Oligoflexia bacterium]HMP49450.1 type I DNA topoisomerase [Oligoflexia bacterium]